MEEFELGQCDKVASHIVVVLKLERAIVIACETKDISAAAVDAACQQEHREIACRIRS